VPQLQRQVTLAVPAGSSDTVAEGGEGAMGKDKSVCVTGASGKRGSAESWEREGRRGGGTILVAQAFVH